jgi:hypothetical protein
VALDSLEPVQFLLELIGAALGQRNRRHGLNPDRKSETAAAGLTRTAAEVMPAVYCSSA